MRIAAIFCLDLLLWCGLNAFGQTVNPASSDSTERIALPPAHVPEFVSHAYGLNVRQLDGAVASIDAKQLRGQLGASIAPALNLEPGVQMDERGYGGSRRISIRGSFLRSPFAVRNIKMYLWGIPLTSPDGSSPLELIEADDLGGLQVIKGPAGSIYGAGNGGVLLFTPRTSSSSGVRNTFSAGSFGWMRNHSALQYTDDDTNLRLSHTWQQSDGFRQQEFNHQHQVLLTGGFRVSETVSYVLMATHFAGRWGLPGSITREDALEGPTLAREFSVANNAHVVRARNRTGVGRIVQKGRFRNETYATVNATTKVNPYGTSPFFNGYKDEAAQGIGGRTVFVLDDVSLVDLQLQWGGEWQREENQLTEWTNASGLPGSLKYDNFTTSTAWTGFVQAHKQWKRGMVMLGLSATETAFNTENEIPLDSLVERSTQAFKPGVEWLPTALVQWSPRKIRLTATVSRGASFPSLFEMIDPISGALDTGLQPETGWNVEGSLAAAKPLKMGAFRVQGKATAYVFRLDNAILPEGDLFENKGEVELRGAEGQLNVYGLFDGVAVVDYISAVALQAYRYSTYGAEASDRDGQHLPAVPLHTWSNRLYLRTVFHDRFRVQLNINHRWVDRQPVDDLNAVWNGAFQLLDGRLDLLLDARNTRWEWGLFGGVTNATDAFYPSFIQANGFGGRWFNAAPNRGFYGGCSIRWTFGATSAKDEMLRER